jgi:alpha-mannosidase
VINDPSDTWSHDIRTYSDETGEFENATVKILEAGPLRATVRVISVHGDSSLTIDWSLASGSENLEAKVTLDWHEHLKMLKFSFPVNVESPVATYEVPYGFIERETNGDEDPGQRWIDVCGRINGKNYGLAIINDAKYGYNVLKNDMRLSVTRSAVYAHHDPWKLDKEEEYIWMDQGIQTFKMVLIPHRGGWKESNVVRCAEELTSPPVFIYQGIHPGRMPKSESFLSVDSPNVIVTAVKQAENNDDLIIRCVETAGEDTEATINLDFADLSWKSNFRGCEIKTLRLNRDKGSISEVKILEE